MVGIVLDVLVQVMLLQFVVMVHVQAMRPLKIVQMTVCLQEVNVQRAIVHQVHIGMDLHAMIALTV